PCPSLRPPAASRRAHEPCPAQMLWAPLLLPAVAPNDVLRLATASTSPIARPAAPRQRRRRHRRCCRPTMAGAGFVTASATNAASRCWRLLDAMLVSVLRPIGQHITDRRLQIDCPVYGF